MTELIKRINKIKKAGYYRKRTPIESPQDVYIKLNNKIISNFSSNNYLNLANSTYLIKQMKKHLTNYGIGSGASPLISGFSEAHLALEKRISKLLSFESTLVMNSGYLANVGLVNAMAEKNIEIFQDKENHNSIIESSRLAGTKLTRYQHLDYEILEKNVIASNADKKIIIADSVFSMTGEESNLEKLSMIASKHKCLLFIDDAHGFGVTRKDHRRFPSSLNGIKNSQIKIDAYVGTFGKAIGTFGAFICGSKSLIDLLIQKSKPYVYSTALPPAIVKTTLDSINYIMKNQSISTRLKENISYFRNLALENDIVINRSDSPIQTIHVGDPRKVMKIHMAALEARIYVQAIRYPTVPLHKDLLRINLTSGHSKKQIQSLVEFLKNIG